VWQGGETNRSNSNGLILNVFIFGLIYCILIPIVQSVWAVLQQLAKNKSWHDILGAIYLGAVVWAVPGLLLGGLVPLLKRAGRNPQSWAFIGYGAAALLIVARILIGVRWPIIPAVLALISGLLFQRGMPVKQFWPFAALSVALGVSGAMSVWQEFTFSGVLIRLHRIDELHPKPPEAPPIPASALYSLTSVQIGQAIRTYASQHPAARPKAPETDNDLTKLDQNAKLLELAISGSVGFWITVGLLACWSMYEREHELPSEFQ